MCQLAPEVQGESTPGQGKGDRRCLVGRRSPEAEQGRRTRPESKGCGRFHSMPRNVKFSWRQKVNQRQSSALWQNLSGDSLCTGTAGLLLSEGEPWPWGWEAPRAVSQGQRQPAAKSYWAGKETQRLLEGMNHDRMRTLYILYCLYFHIFSLMLWNSECRLYYPMRGKQCHLLFIVYLKKSINIYWIHKFWEHTFSSCSSYTVFQLLAHLK